MPHYAYRAVDEKGQMNKGEANAANENELYAQLHQQGLSLVDCKTNHKKQSGFLQQKIQMPEQVLLCRHLLMLTRAGVPIHTALGDILPALPKKLQPDIQTILSKITAGENLSSAFARSSLGFDPLFSLLLQAGEKTGKLSEALTFLHESLSWKAEYTQKLKKALSYPFVQIMLAATAVIVLMTVAVPQIIQMLDMIGEKLPWYSVMLLWGMKLLGAAIALLAVGLVFSLTFVPLIKKIHEDIALTFDRLFLSLPVIGKLFNKIELAQLTHVFAAMLSSGVAMMDALLLLPSLTQNRAMAASLHAVTQQVAGGQGLSAVLTKQMLIPSYVVRILKIGEESGKMAESLRHISAVYQQESQESLDELLKISSLFITCAVGLILVLMVIGVMVPLYRGISQMGAA